MSTPALSQASAWTASLTGACSVTRASSLRGLRASFRHYDRVAMRSELVALFHEAEPGMAELTDQICQQPALLEFIDAGGVEQSVWRANPEESAALTRHSGQAPALHRGRSPAGSRPLSAAGNVTDSPKTSSVLCALYPQDQVFLHAFHRRVLGPAARCPSSWRRSGQASSYASPPGLTSVPGPSGCTRQGAGSCSRRGNVATVTGVAGLDVTVLDDQVLRPLLGMQDGDPRLEFLPELRDLGPTIRACDEDGGVLFTLHAAPSRRPHLRGRTPRGHERKDHLREA